MRDQEKEEEEEEEKDRRGGSGGVPYLSTSYNLRYVRWGDGQTRMRRFLIGRIESSSKVDMKKGRRVNLSIVSRSRFSFSRVGIDQPLRRSELSKRIRTANRKRWRMASRLVSSRLVSAVATTALSGRRGGIGVSSVCRQGRRMTALLLRVLQGRR